MIRIAVRCMAVAVLSIGIMGWSEGPVFADEQGEPRIELNPLSIEGASLQKIITVDRQFEQKYERPVPAPFQFGLPVSDTIQTFIQPPVPNDVTLLKISFATPGKELIENIRFIPMTVPKTELPERIKATARLLAQKAFPMAVEGYQGAKRLGVVQANIGDYDAVVVVGQYHDPQLGPMFVRLVGVLHPDSEHCILMIANIVPKHSEAKAPDQLHKQGMTFRVIESLHYLPIPDE